MNNNNNNNINNSMSNVNSNSSQSNQNISTLYYNSSSNTEQQVPPGSNAITPPLQDVNTPTGNNGTAQQQQQQQPPTSTVLMIMPNGPNSFPPSLRKLRHLRGIMCRNLVPMINRNLDIGLPNAYFTIHAPPLNNETNSNIDQEVINDNDDEDENCIENSSENEDIVLNKESIIRLKHKYNTEDEQNHDYNSIDDEDDDDGVDLPPSLYTSEVIPNSYNPVWSTFDCYQPISNDILDTYNTFNICIWDKAKTNYNIDKEMNDEEEEEEQMDELLFQTEIDLTQLEFIAQEIKQFVNLIIPPNSIIFELKDGLYVTRETKLQMRSTKLNDYKFISNQHSDKRKAITGNQALFLSVLGKKIQNIKNIEQSSSLSEKIESRLESNQSYLDKIKRLETLRHRVDQLRQEYYNQVSSQEKEKENIENLRKDLVPKATALTNAGIIFYSSFQSLAEHVKVVDMDRLLLNNIKSSLEKKKWHLLSQIRTIYPIQQGNKSLTISGLPLPNSDFNGFDEELISTALGYVCHILHLASRYLDIPLRYPMTPMASRSFIKDEISHHSSSKFPLYSKGVEKRIFDYAVFLLNKNLEQLLNSQGLGMFSLKETLSNVMILLGRSRIS